MIIAIFFIFFSVWARAENPSAYEVYSKLLEEGVDSSVRYSEGMVEGWLLVRIGVFSDLLNLMSPSSDTLDEFVQSLSPQKRELFLREFVSREKKVWREFLAEEKKKTDTPLISVSNETSRDIFYGAFPGLEGKGLSSTFDKQWNFVPDEKLKAEQYVSVLSSVEENPSAWMITFREQKSYGDLQDLIRWSRKLLDMPNFSNVFNKEIRLAIGDLSAKQEKIGFRLSKITDSYGDFASPFSERFYHQATLARIFSGDLSGTGGLLSLDRIWPTTLPKAPELASRFGVSMDTAEKAFTHLTNAMNFYRDKDKLLLPLSSWQNIPSMGETKKRAMKTLARVFLERSARVKGNGQSKAVQILNLYTKWIFASFLTEDMEFKLAPKPRGPVGKVLNFKIPPSSENAVDVNKVNLGIEYTGRFPVNHEVSDPFPWSRERKKLMRDLARELSLELRGDGKVQKKAGGHGHGLGHSYTFLDGKGRSWSVDWDGVRRRYDAKGKIKKGSVGGGHLEVSTAKFVPKAWEIEAVYKIFKKFSIIPHQSLSGAGHINVDLAPFEERPRAVARFLALFHQYQNLIEFMFYGEEFDFPVRDDLAKRLRDFRGSERELKELLYNERYFYSLQNSKTRYAPVNITFPIFKK